MRHFSDALFEDIVLETTALNEDFKTKNLLILGDPQKDLLELLSSFIHQNLRHRYAETIAII